MLSEEEDTEHMEAAVALRFNDSLMAPGRNGPLLEEEEEAEERLRALAGAPRAPLVAPTEALEFIQAVR